MTTLVNLFDLCQPKQWPVIAATEMTASGYPVFGANGRIGYSDTYTHEEPVLLIGCRGSCGTVHITPPFAYANGNAMALDQLDTSRVDMRYLFHFLRHRGFSDVVTGSSQPQITQTTLRRVQVPLPPLREQRRIATELETVADLMVKRQHSLAMLGALLQSVFMDTFGDPRTNPKGWPVLALEQVARVNRGKFTPRPRNDPQFYGGEIPFIQTGDVVAARTYVTSHKQTLNEKGLAVSRSFDAGTVAITIAANIGATAILTYAMCFPDSVVGIEPDPEKAVPEFVEMQLRFFRKKLEDGAPQTAQKNINLEDLRPLRVIVPPLAEQRRFAGLSRRAEDHAIVLDRHLIQLAELFASLQRLAFGGRHFNDLNNISSAPIVARG